ncbi:LacI family DNA-binding transcriptional regulator [Labrys wisconsinensis]|uniref:DNA-binding LacI/PurR family transcriptional regulator n=1 Tax=Labrys wisconsinensis TaxID=425677 RepID=A0ABU0JJU6_9HYPH|nr:LacI family DNA-binding transcriptional regulator [Labrys wisconsinensis]MDQ0474550.1 DNA-binding LacI/PurR family transcriptional regulator [Labrys wisconsinensis]
MIDRKIRNMAEFSALSGISRPTVSKYFNDPNSVRKSTRALIEQALAKYEYRPNLFAVNLNKRRPRIIGVIVPDTADTFFSELVRRIEIRCVDKGYLAIVLSSRGDAQLEARSIETLLSLKIAGAIVAPLGIHSDMALMRSLRARIPIVFLDSRLDDDTPFVGTDNFQSVPLITEYLCRTGERPTYFDMPAVNHNASERKLAYVKAMQRLGLKPEIITVGPQNDWRFEDIAFAETLRVIDGPGFPTRTILCANDRCAVGVMAAAYQRGLRIGREPGCDIRIAGHDDQPLSRYGCPPLTTVAQDFERLAQTSVDILLKRIEAGEADAQDPRPELVRLEAKLVMRASA